MLQSRSKLHTRDDGKRDRERDGDRCSVLVGDDILHGGAPDTPDARAASVRLLTVGLVSSTPGKHRHSA